MSLCSSPQRRYYAARISFTRRIFAYIPFGARYSTDLLAILLPTAVVAATTALCLLSASIVFSNAQCDEEAYRTYDLK